MSDEGIGLLFLSALFFGACGFFVMGGIPGAVLGGIFGVVFPFFFVGGR